MLLARSNKFLKNYHLVINSPWSGYLHQTGTPGRSFPKSFGSILYIYLGKSPDKTRAGYLTMVFNKLRCFIIQDHSKVRPPRFCYQYWISPHPPHPPQINVIFHIYLTNSIKYPSCMIYCRYSDRTREIRLSLCLPAVFVSGARGGAVVPVTHAHTHTHKKVQHTHQLQLIAF